MENDRIITTVAEAAVHKDKIDGDPYRTSRACSLINEICCIHTTIKLFQQK